MVNSPFLIRGHAIPRDVSFVQSCISTCVVCAPVRRRRLLFLDAEFPRVWTGPDPFVQSPAGGRWRVRPGSRTNEAAVDSCGNDFTRMRFQFSRVNTRVVGRVHLPLDEQLPEGVPAPLHHSHPRRSRGGARRPPPSPNRGAVSPRGWRVAPRRGSDVRFPCDCRGSAPSRGPWVVHAASVTNCLFVTSARFSLGPLSSSSWVLRTRDVFCRQILCQACHCK